MEKTSLDQWLALQSFLLNQLKRNDWLDCETIAKLVKDHVKMIDDDLDRIAKEAHEKLLATTFTLEVEYGLEALEKVIDGNFSTMREQLHLWQARSVCKALKSSGAFWLRHASCQDIDLTPGARELKLVESDFRKLGKTVYEVWDTLAGRYDGLGYRFATVEELLAFACSESGIGICHEYNIVTFGSYYVYRETGYDDNGFSTGLYNEPNSDPESSVLVVPMMASPCGSFNSLDEGIPSFVIMQNRELRLLGETSLHLLVRK